MTAYKPGWRGTRFVSVHVHCRDLMDNQASHLNRIAFSLMVGFSPLAGVTWHPQAWHMQVSRSKPVALLHGAHAGSWVSISVMHLLHWIHGDL